MDAADTPKDQAILINGLAVEKLRSEQDKLRSNGVRMSLSAIASKIIMETMKGA